MSDTPLPGMGSLATRFPDTNLSPEDESRLDALLDREPDDGKEPCPECGKRFVPGPGMGVHRRSVHGVINKNTKLKTCPECGTQIGRKDMARHIRTVHGKTTTTPKRRGRPPGAPNKPKPQDWTADEIFDVVITTMWPTGRVPIAVISPLVRWKEATVRMLDEVRANG